MRVILTDSFQACEEEFHIDRDEAVESYKYYDEEQKLNAQGLEIRMYAKQFQDYCLLTQGMLRNGSLHIDAILKLPIAFVKDAGTNEPLALLRQLSHFYGMTIKIGKQRDNFFFNELVAISANDQTKLVDITNRENHSSLESVWVKTMEEKGKHFARCGLAYCIDIDIYKAAVKGKNVLAS
jgi:hypothetical protein